MRLLISGSKAYFSLIARCPVTLRDLKPSPPVARAIIHLLTSSGKLHKCQWLFCVFDNTNYTKTLARILNAVCNSNFVWSHNLNVWDEIRDGWVSHGRVLIQFRSQYVSHDCSEPIYYYHFWVDTSFLSFHLFISQITCFYSSKRYKWQIFKSHSQSVRKIVSRCHCHPLSYSSLTWQLNPDYSRFCQKCVSFRIHPSTTQLRPCIDLQPFLCLAFVFSFWFRDR